MLHLELEYADLEHNLALIKTGIELAAAHRADWVITPELALTGYRFDLKLGVSWIEQGPDRYVQAIQTLARENQLVIFLSHLEGIDDQRYNTLFVIDRNGDIIGRHNKINTIPVAEDWSTAGLEALPTMVDGYRVGLLICADVWPAEHVESLRKQGADLILSSASWAPGQYGPGDVWERRSRESGLPILVNNRTGLEREFDLTASQSVVSIAGERVYTHSSDTSALVLLDWNVNTKALNSSRSLPIDLIAVDE